jgi:hypothetical protein
MRVGRMENFCMTQVEALSLAAPAKLGAQVPKRPRGQLELLQAKLERAIRRRTGDRVRNLDVKIQENHVEVRGRCGSYYSKQQVGQAAMAVMKKEPALEAAVMDNKVEVY